MVAARREAPRELAVFDHVLVAAPDVVHENVHPVLFTSDAAKERFSSLIIGVVAANGYAAFTKLRFLDGAAGDVDRCSGFSQAKSRAPSNPRLPPVTRATLPCKSGIALSRFDSQRVARFFGRFARITTAARHL